MRRRPLLLAAVLAAALVAALLPARAALAGGVCRGERVTDAKGTTVTMRDFCYRPTVLRVQPGAQVTFVNKDVEAHPTVGHGGAWGIDGVTGGRPAAGRSSSNSIDSSLSSAASVSWSREGRSRPAQPRTVALRCRPGSARNDASRRSRSRQGTSGAS